MNFDQPFLEPVKKPISRREFLTGEWDDQEESKKKLADESKDEIDKIVDGIKEKEISRRNLLTGKWFN
ncbi:MAG TPA: hypothetical protein DEA43_02080 [Candidatus Moranbacteria bacterium]|nr:hypothetical protein [Candidatus Moranbacteria bacterium]HBT45652.1 hypothetical protein [Candidatus Moranbacteria bacterium]